MLSQPDRGEIDFEQFDGIEHEDTASPENSARSEK